jgi:hypothetical protein
MRKNKNEMTPRNRMLYLGQWLETFLSPEIDDKGLAELVLDEQWGALRLLNINYPDSFEEDYTVRAVRDAQANKLFHDKTLIENLKKANKLVHRMRVDPYVNYDEWLDNQPEWVKFARDFGYLLTSIENIGLIFKCIKSSVKLWHKTLEDIFSKKGGKEHAALKYIMNGYELIGDELRLPLHFKEDTKQIKGYSSKEQYSYMFWHTVPSKIMFEFLRNGGAIYFDYCNRCGRFISVSRQNRKKYCTNNCRALHHQENQQNT